MRYDLKKFILLILYYIFNNRRNNDLLVLNYHRITDIPDFNDPLKVSKNIFEKQIKYLKENYKIISGEELLEIIRNNAPIPNNSCLITFDDGWRDNYINAYPILKKYKVPAIIFVSTDFIGTNKIFWHEQLQDLLNKISIDTNDKEYKKILIDLPNNIINLITKIIEQPKLKRQIRINELIATLKSFDPKYRNMLIYMLTQHYNQKLNVKPLMLTWSEINKMSKNNINFGSHTKSHPILTQIEEEIIIKELNESKNVLEEHLKKPVYYFSYPNGNYNENIANRVKEAGYVAAFAMVKGKNYSKNNLYAIKRSMIKEQSSSGINGKFSALFFKIELSGIRNKIKNISI